MRLILSQLGVHRDFDDPYTVLLGAILSPGPDAFTLEVYRGDLNGHFCAETLSDLEFSISVGFDEWSDFKGPVGIIPAGGETEVFPTYWYDGRSLQRTLDAYFCGAVEISTRTCDGGTIEHILMWNAVGAQDLIEVDTAEVYPPLGSNVERKTTGDATTKEVQRLTFYSQPLVKISSETADWTAVPDPVLTSTFANGLQRISFDRPPAGGFFTLAAGDPIRFNASAAEVATETGECVTKPGAFRWDISTASELAVDASSIYGHSGLLATIPGITSSCDLAASAKICAPGWNVSGSVTIHAGQSGSGSAPSQSGTSYTATEDIAAGRLVNIYDDGFGFKIRAASASGSLRADGYINESVLNGGTVTVYDDDTMTGLTGILPSAYYLGENGLPSATPRAGGSGGIHQPIGNGTSATTISIELETPITLL